MRFFGSSDALNLDLAIKMTCDKNIRNTCIEDSLKECFDPYCNKI